MRTRAFARVLACISTLAFVHFTGACSSESSNDASGRVSGEGASWAADAAPKPGSPPAGSAPTGQRWEGVEVDDGCGRKRIQYVLVDETCAGFDDPNYSRAFQSPMFRDGAIVGDSLFAVDATHLWSLALDSSSAGGDPTRRALLSGVGLPLAVDKLGSTLVVAAGESGIVLVDAAMAAAPIRSGDVALPGFAADVHVDGTKAYVALGKRGIGVVDLAAVPPALEYTIDIPNAFAAGVRVKGTHAYVAACSTFAVVDLESKAVVGRVWHPDAVRDRVLVAPAKDVEVVGNVAFVAAGRYGAIAVDVSQPTAPALLGNCSEQNDPAFYASGVRAEGASLFVAAGEWGVLPVSVSTPAGACATNKPPSFSTPPPKSDCSADAPWEVVPWEQLWAPPPPRKDPIQTLPAGDKLYAFGDARRIGTRAVDVRDTTQASLPIVFRYDEPRALLGVAASATRVLAVGKHGGLFQVTAGGLTRVVTTQDALIRESTAAAFGADGTWAVLRGQDVVREGGAAISVGPVNPEVLAPDGDDFYVVATDHVARVGTTLTQLPLSAGTSAKLPPSLVVDGTTAYFTSPESSRVQVVDASGSYALVEHGLFTAETLARPDLWQQRLPRHLLAMTTAGLAEVAAVGPHAGLALRGPQGVRTAELPAATYGAIASTGNRVVLAGIDRGLYRTILVTIATDTGSPVIVDTELFTGVAAGIAMVGSRVYVADADGRIRIYEDGQSGLSHQSDVATEAL